MKNLLLVTAFAAAVLLLTAPDAARADGEGAKYDLSYKFTAGETVRMTVTDAVTVETKIRGTSQVAKTHSVSTKAWKIKSVNDQGDITLVHSVEDVDMWNKISLRPKVQFNSRTSEEIPAGYKVVAESIGKPLVEVTINRHGGEISRKELYKRGGAKSTVVLPMPEKPVKIGDSWNHPNVYTARLRSGVTERVNVREHFELKKVENGIAHISVDTQLLNTVDDAAVWVQIMQKVQHGTIEFDLAKGRIVSRKWDANENAVSFNGADSMMKYTRAFQEKIKSDTPATAGKKSSDDEPQKR